MGSILVLQRLQLEIGVTINTDIYINPNLAALQASFTVDRVFTKCVPGLLQEIYRTKKASKRSPVNIFKFERSAIPIANY
jgi:hypothetical protein